MARAASLASAVSSPLPPRGARASGAAPALLTPAQPVSALLQGFSRYRELLVPIACLGLVLVLLVPLPPLLLDVLLVGNLALAAVLLLSVLLVRSPLELSVFPSLLLVATLSRLVLNVACTRLILTAPDRAADAAHASSAAGHMIRTFSDLVAGGSLAVGLLLFLVLLLIQFLVITKGAGRIAEVAARFTLEALPGKQLAIDADLNAGLIDKDEARRRRSELGQAADFYGAMDGASRFLRGDAIAALVLLALNLIGGIAIGMLQYRWGISDCFRVFTRLTIGEGLVAQVPAFLICLAAGILVTRRASEENLGEAVVQQVGGKATALWTVAGFLLVLALAGLPPLPLLTLAGLCALAAWSLGRRPTSPPIPETHSPADASAPAAAPPVDALLAVELLELEVGYRLLKLLDEARGGDLLDRLAALRRQLATELGLVVPAMQVRDTTGLPPHHYRVKLRGNPVAQGSVHPGKFLAVQAGETRGELPGIPATDPAFGLPAVWIAAGQRAEAESLGYTVVEAAAVLATHLTETLRTHAAELLTREEVHALLKHLKERAPKLVEDVVPGQIKPGELHRLLQELLRERVPIRDLETILEAVSDAAPKAADRRSLVEAVRGKLARSICRAYTDDQNRLYCVTLDPQVEETLLEQMSRPGGLAALPPAVRQQMVHRTVEQLGHLRQQGHPGVVLCSAPLRQVLRDLLEPVAPAVAVLAYGEVARGVQVEALGMVRAA